MANQCNEDGQNYQIKPIHFLRFILPHILQQGKLMIPRMFVKKYGEGLPETVFLKTSNGVEWKVNLVNHDGKIWFQEGWKEFAEYHSLSEGHILVFRYERTSSFQVLIFDMTALEIDYPFERVESKMASNDQENKSPIVESLEAYRPTQKRKDNLSLDVLQQFKKRNICAEVESIPNFSKSTLHLTGKKYKEEPEATAKEITTLDRARSFKPCNPSFLLIMRPSSIHANCNLHLPSKFVKRYFDLSINRVDVILQIANGRIWLVRYVTRDNGTKFELSKKGWRRFAKDNNLKVGDACTFELVDRKMLTFQVYIFSETNKSKCATFQEQPMTAATKQITALDRARSFKPCNPSCLVVIHRSYINSSGPVLPSKFWKTHIDFDMKGGDINLQVSNGRVWPGRYHIRDSFEIMSGGWKAFAKDNKLKVGDVCTFELIDRTKLTFQVYIFSETDNSSCSTSQEPTTDGPKNHGVPIQVKIES